MADQVFSYPTESWHESDFSSGQQETNMDCKHKYLAVCRLKNIRTQATGFQLQLTHCMKILCANCIIFFFKNFPSLIYLFAAIALSSGTHTITPARWSRIYKVQVSAPPRPRSISSITGPIHLLISILLTASLCQEVLPTRIHLQNTLSCFLFK